MLSSARAGRRAIAASPRRCDEEPDCRSRLGLECRCTGELRATAARYGHRSGLARDAIARGCSDSCEREWLVTVAATPDREATRHRGTASGATARGSAATEARHDSAADRGAGSRQATDRTAGLRENPGADHGEAGARARATAVRTDPQQAQDESATAARIAGAQSARRQDHRHQGSRRRDRCDATAPRRATRARSFEATDDAAAAADRIAGPRETSDNATATARIIGAKRDGFEPRRAR
jgi:hypothetical protein